MRKSDITIDFKTKLTIAKQFARDRCLEGSFAIFADSHWAALPLLVQFDKQVNNTITAFQLPHDWFTSTQQTHDSKYDVQHCLSMHTITRELLLKDLPFVELTIQACFNFVFGWLNDLHNYTSDFRHSPSFTNIPDIIKLSVQFALSCYQLTLHHKIRFQNLSTYSYLIRMCALIRHTHFIPQLSVNALQFIRSNMISKCVTDTVSREQRLSIFRDVSFSYALNHQLDSLLSSLQLLFPSEIESVIQSIQDLCARFGNANLANECQRIFDGSFNDKIAHLNSHLTPLSPFCESEDISIADLKVFTCDKDTCQRLKFYSNILSTFDSMYPPTVQDLRQLSTDEKWIENHNDEIISNENQISSNESDA